MAKRPGKRNPAPLSVRAARILAKLESLKSLDVREKSVHALGLAASPQERWDLLEQRVRSLGYWKPLKKRKSVTRSSG